MTWKRYLIAGCMIILITEYQTDESLSFSPSQSRSLNSPISYWYGNKTIFKDKFLLEEGVDIDLYLNKQQGLLFYSIDNKYRTFWVEFLQNEIAITYYNFRIDDVDRRIYKLETICNEIYGNRINLKFILKNNEILTKCNGKAHSIEYFRPMESISDATFQTFIKQMVLPIPIFSHSNETQETIVHLWIGNTPATNDNLYINKIELKQNPLNFFGCITQFSISDLPLKIASTGFHNGDLITKSCDPVCPSNPCMNNGYCIEQWRGRFSCNCSLSRFIGEFCNRDYAVRFDGNLVVRFSKNMKLQKIQFSFQPVIYGESSPQKLLSIKFLADNFIHVYRAGNYFLHARFLPKNSQPKDIYFKSQLGDQQNYTFTIETMKNGLLFKLADAQMNSLIDEKPVALDDNNLIVDEVLLGESHGSLMNWMNKFHGCISNFVMTHNRKQFIWNEISQFSSLPKCGEPTIPPSTVAPRVPSKNPPEMLSANERSKQKSNSVEILNSITISISIGIVLTLLLIFVVVIVIIKWRKRDPKKLNYEEKLILKPNYPPDDNTDHPYAISYTTPRTSITPVIFKPAYTARSMSSSINGRSMISLPLCTTPPLVTAEEGTIL